MSVAKQNELTTEQLLADQDAMAVWYEMQIQAVKTNCNILSSVEIGQDYMLHIDKNKPNEFYAKIPEATLTDENTTVARITVSTTIFGCIIGYNRIETDALAIDPEKYQGGEDYRGGYTISKLFFSHAIKPNEKLVPDANLSQEYWLVNYDEQHAVYKPKSVGELVLKKLEVLPNNGKTPYTIQTYSISVLDPFKLSDDVVLEKGYYCFSVEVAPKHTKSPPKLLSLSATDAGEHARVKKDVAITFSMERLPPSMRGW